MADLTIFYSWQSDLPRRISRDVIQEATATAIENLKVDASIEDAPRLDHDTQGVPGAPEIAGTIFRKIERCGIFLADLSFVGLANPSSDPSKSAKRLPNPNVLLELGYAVGRIGWERVILVMNTAFGAPDELIFDLRHRRFPLVFELRTDDPKDAKAVQARLSKRVEEAVRASLQSEHAAVSDAIGNLTVHALQWLNAYGQKESFPHPERKNMGEILSGQQMDNALARLIDLGILKCDVSADGKQYAYHWTYLGKLVLRKLGVRSTATTVNPVES